MPTRYPSPSLGNLLLCYLTTVSSNNLDTSIYVLCPSPSLGSLIICSLTTVSSNDLDTSIYLLWTRVKCDLRVPVNLVSQSSFLLHLQSTAVVYYSLYTIHQLESSCLMVYLTYKWDYQRT